MIGELRREVAELEAALAEARAHRGSRPSADTPAGDSRLEGELEKVLAALPSLSRDSAPEDPPPSRGLVEAPGARRGTGW